MSEQKCPVCDGTGLVRRPPWVAGDQEWSTTEWSTTSIGLAAWLCKRCNGVGTFAPTEALANKQETAVDQDEEIERLTNRLAGDTADHILAIYLEHSWPTRRRQSVDLSVCPECGGPADNGHDRAYPPSPYLCTKCTQETE